MDNKPTILIVDDDPKFRKTLSDILRAKGYRAIAAAKGKTALDRVKEEMPAVALIDLKLPDMDGLKVMREIKKRSPDTECIVLTGHASQASVIEAVNLGAYGYMQKPYDMEQLVATIRRAIEKREAEEVLRESEERYRTILDDIEDGYFEVDIAGNFTFFNDSLCRIIGYSRDEMMGMNNRHYMDKENAKKVFQAFNRVYTTGKPTKGFDWEIIRKDGTRRFVEASASPIRGSEGEPIGFRGIVRDITERKRAEEEIRRRSAYLETLLRINATLRGTLPLSQVLEMIVQGAAEALGYLGCFVAMPDARGERLTVGAVWGGRIVDAVLKVTPFKLDSFSVPVKAQENIIARAFVTGELQTSSGEPEGLAVGAKPPIGAKMAKVIERIAGARGAVCVPLRVAEKTVGVLIVVSPREQLADEERAMLLGLADQAGLAIENARLYEETRRKAEELAVLNEIGRAVSSVMQLDDLLELISQEASRVLDTSNLYLALYDAKKNELTFPLYFEEGERRKPERRSPRRGITEYVINSAKPLMINRDLVSRLKKLNIELIGKPSKSWLGVPMLSEDRAIGVLAIQDYQKENAYDESHLRLLSTIASQAAIAIENARLYDKTQRHLKEMTTLQRVGMELTSFLDLSTLLQGIAQSTLELTNADYVHIFTLRPDTGEFTQRAASWRHEAKKPPITWPRKKGLTAAVLEAQEPVIIEKATDHPLYATPEARKWDVKSVAGFPLQGKWGLTGVLNVVFLQPHTFSEDELDLLALLASQAAIAIENARLYQQARQHTSELSTLDLVGLTLTSTRDLLTVLDLIVESCQRLTGTPGVHIFLYDQITGEFTHGAGRWDPQQKEPTLRMPRKGGVSDTVAKQGKPLVINDARNHPLYSSPEAQSWGINAVAGFPLQGAEALLGVLYVAFFTPHAFVEDELRVLSLLANLATAAIENARSYQSLKKQNLETISALAAAVEAKDPYTSGHSEKVTQFAIAIAEKMGLSNDEIEDLRVAGLLHDIGKIGIPDSVLNKPARLTPAEFLMIKTHSAISAEIVERIEALAPIVPIIRHHHERWDGDGYPDRLKGEDIPLLARILAVADGFEAMTSERPYRRARTEEEAVAELEKGAGSQWDPHVVEVFVTMKTRP